MSDSTEINPAREAFMAMADSSTSFICLASTHGKPFYLNRAGRRLVGLGEDNKLPPASLHDMHSEQSWCELRDVAVPAVNARGHWEGTAQLRHCQTDEAIDVDTQMFLIRDPGTGKPNTLAVVHRDIRGQLQMEQAIRESEARKHAILESALDPIITINHEGLITEFNRAAEQVFGHPRQRVLQTKPSDVLFPANDTAGQRSRIERYLEAGEGSLLGKRSEVTAVRAGGETFPAEMAMTLSQEHGEPLLTFFVRDISDRKRAEAEQAHYAADLERSNRELEQFAYVASHDLQEPLRKIRTFGDRLETRCREMVDDVGRECLYRMQDAAERMQSLIDGLLTLSRVTTKGQDFVRVDLGQIAADVVSDLEVQIEQAEARVEVGKLPTIHADPLQMRQLFQNLLGNALKFRREGEPPLIRIEGRFEKGRTERSAVTEERCRLTVEDNGIGFDEKYLDRIFTVFQRLHTRDLYEGTGVGLAICRKIAERHGGTITAESTPGKGSKFIVVLPAVHRKSENRHEI